MSIGAKEKGRRKKNSLVKKIAVSTLIVGSLMCVFFLLFHVRADRSCFKYELGQTVSRNLEDYISGLSWSVNLSQLDISSVDESKVGKYKATLKHGPFQKFTYEIEIEDTTPPQVAVSSKVIAVQRLEDYKAQDFISSYSDLSGQVYFSFASKSSSAVRISEDKTRLMGMTNGEEQLIIQACDPSGNTLSLPINIIIDDPPIIDGGEDYYITLGSQPDFLKEIAAYDEVDGLIDNVEFSVSGDFENFTGDYTIVYSATDSFGFTGSKEVGLHVMEPLELQELVNNHQVDGNSEYVIGAINPYDMGVSGNNSISRVESLLIPSLVHLRVDYPNGGYVHGSGFVISIFDDKVIICTNNHVVGDLTNMNAYFFDGSMANAKVVSSVAVPDIAFLQVNINDLPDYTRKNIKTVHLNTPYFNSLSDQPDLDIMIRSNYKSGDLWKRDEGYIVRKSGVLSQYFAGFDYPVTEIRLDLVGGMSGSPVVDGTGNLICMATYKWFNGSYYECYGVKVTDIVAYFKEIFSRDADYYIACQN